LTHPMSESLLRRRLVIAPLFIAVIVYGVVVIGDEYELQVLVTPALSLGFVASPFAAWLLVRSERRHTFGKSSATGKRMVIGVLVIVLGGVVLSRVVIGLLIVLEIGLTLFAGMLIASGWELWRGTYRARQSQASGE
jgi:hypothetical protein